MKRILRTTLMAVAVLTATGLMPGAGRVEACPGCKTANETDDRRPRAYMISILFMLGMPATVFAGFSIAFYRLSRKAAAEAALLAETEQPDSPVIIAPEIS
ncbi:MAG: hypothetical protein JNM43_20060 [Planctomycetaceae bacterium]|nr:hypothetical protein [Planctomycetaceae bacterium]